MPVTTSPIPGRVKARSIGMRKSPPVVPPRGSRSAMRGALAADGAVKSAIPSPLRLDTGKIGLSANPAAASSTPTSLDHRGGPIGLDPVDLGDDPGDLGDPDQFEDVEVLQRLRTRPVIRGDDQQHPVDRQHAGQHVGQEPLVPRHVDKPELGAVGQRRIGKAEIDRQPASLLLRQAIGVDPGQRLHQRGLAVIDMASGREDHGLPWASAGSWPRKAASSSRQRRSRRTRPASMRPMTGTGNARSAPRQRLDGSAGPTYWRVAPGRRSAAATPVMRRCRSGCCVSTRLASAMPSSACVDSGQQALRQGPRSRRAVERAAAAPAAARPGDRDRRRGAAPLRVPRDGSCRGARRA